MGISVFLSPSNQDANLWCTGTTNEEKEAVKFADAISDYLSPLGVEVVRADGIEPFKRFQYAQNCKCYVPLHTNAFNGKVRGNRLFILKNGNSRYADSLLLASALKVGFDTLGHPEKSAIYTDFAKWNELVNASAIGVPCVYSETIFHDNREDVKFYRENFDRLARVYANAIAQFCGIIIEDEPPETDEKIFYRVIAGAFSDKRNAEKRLAEVKKIEENAYIQIVRS